MTKWKIVLIVSVSVMVIALAALAWSVFPLLFSGEVKDVVPNNTSESVAVPDTSATPTELPPNPIDFTALQAQNPDVYAWIQVPGTRVDYPVLRSNDKPEDYYLNHNINEKYEFAGCIYSQMLNSDDFSDPNTILYGHNMNNGSMFASLHNFRKASFFKEHQYIYIYTPGRILTYTIYAAYRYDNRHILYSFNFKDKQVFADYLAMTKNPKSTIVNVRDEVEVTADDRIITLSTCITNDNYRYLVQGVLTNVQPTK